MLRIVICLQCGEEFQVAEERAVKEVPCPVCGNRVSLPSKLVLPSTVSADHIQASPLPQSTRAGIQSSMQRPPPPIVLDTGEHSLTGPVTEEEIRTFVGPNAGYYCERWMPVLEGRESGAGFNGTAFLFTGLWLPYRKLYGATFAFYGALVAVMVLELLLKYLVGMEIPIVGGEWLVALVAWIVCGFSANKWYLSRALRVIARARSRQLRKDAHLRWIAGQGGISVALPVGVFASLLGLSVAISLAPIALSFLGTGLGDKLTYHGGDLYYTSSVSQPEAQRLGDYLVKVGFFDGKPKTVQLTRSGNRIEFRMVVRSGFEHNQQFIDTARQFSLELSRDVFRGGPVDVHLCDPYMNTLKVVQGR